MARRATARQWTSFGSSTRASGAVNKLRELDGELDGELYKEMPCDAMLSSSGYVSFIA